MRFLVVALSSVPDTTTARRLFGLDDLDDKDVSKVLMHRRKQQTGSSEILRWDQRAIAALTLIRHSVDKVQIESMNLAAHTEAEMLEAFYKGAMRDGCTVSWDGQHKVLPLIHFRTLMHEVSYPAYWQALKMGLESHLDVRGWLSTAPEDRPELDETARKLGFPGMLKHDEDSVVRAWLQNAHAGVQAYSDITALNTYLLASRLFGVKGEMTRHDAGRTLNKLRDELARRDEPHLAEFLSAWTAP